MASVQLTKKAFTLPPTVRTLASGVPSASLLNLSARAPAHDDHHAHGAVGPRSDSPAAWATKVHITPSGLVSKNFAAGEAVSSCSPAQTKA
jgi:ubiquinol-cytochrome c reductase iron-sulfur subunit